MKKLFAILTALLLALSASACGKSSTPQPGVKLRHAEITVKNYGTIKLELDAGTAPITVANFIDLAQKGFYDGLTFHRIMNGFMIQGGAPNASSKIKPKTIKGEFSANGVENPIKHVEGVISMARANDKNSASSQFFIMVGTAPHLDGNYAAFGHVTEGLEIVKQIAADARPIDNNGTIPAAQQPVIEKIVITD
ncbi:MAG: peptidylprolyl isomerase [Lachnospiraceae bacterium]|nr:peptidylprolyl isomerase [Lachnospiraceae bacterium]